MKEYAYIRVSSRDQNIARQVEAMKEIGLMGKQLYIDRQSGKDFERKGYQKLLKQLKAGDVLYIKSIDRLGRNYEEIIVQWGFLTKEKQIDIVVLDFPLLDTRQKDHGLTGQFLADMTLQILSYVAQMERENIRQRQREGIQAAKAAGVRFGRPPKVVPTEFADVYQLWKGAQINKSEAARMLDTNCTTFTRWAKKWKESNKKG